MELCALQATTQRSLDGVKLMLSRIGIAFMRWLGGLPLPWVRALGVCMGGCLYVAIRSRRRVVETNLLLCFPRANCSAKTCLNTSSVHQVCPNLAGPWVALARNARDDSRALAPCWGLDAIGGRFAPPCYLRRILWVWMRVQPHCHRTYRVSSVLSLRLSRTSKWTPG
jgi:hypothetical protein